MNIFRNDEDIHDLTYLTPRMVNVLAKPESEKGFGIKNPSKVQSLVYPLVLKPTPDGSLPPPQRLLIKAQTGSGKTLAYLVPIINKLTEESRKTPIKRQDGTRALIMVPTRELCNQVADVATKLVNNCSCNLIVGTLIGGEDRQAEKVKIRKGIVILVVTPGRLLDHMATTESLRINTVSHLVFDEVDRLLDFDEELQQQAKKRKEKEENAETNTNNSVIVHDLLSIMMRADGKALIKYQERNKQQGNDSKSSSYQQYNMHQRWKNDTFLSSRVIPSEQLSKLTIFMVTATLTKFVKQMACKLMLFNFSNNETNEKNSMYLVDGEMDSVHKISTASTLDNIGKDTGLLDGSTVQGETMEPSVVRGGGEGTVKEAVNRGKTQSDGTVSFMDEEETFEANAIQRSTKSMLAKGESLSESTPQQLTQHYMIVPCKWRLAALFSFLKLHKKEKVIVFFSTCDSVDYHALLLREARVWPQSFDDIDYQSYLSDLEKEKANSQVMQADWNDEYGGNDVAKKSSRKMQQAMGRKDGEKRLTERPSHAGERPSLEPIDSTFTTAYLGKRTMIYRLHGNVSNTIRQNVYKDFCKAESASILLCTDVAARGLDLPLVDWIVQFDAPTETIDYVHRIGRTARKGNAGSSLLFLMPSELPYVTTLQSHGLQSHPISLKSVFEDMGNQYMDTERLKKKQNASQLDELYGVIVQKQLEDMVRRNGLLTQAGNQAYRSFVRAYATHVEDYQHLEGTNGTAADGYIFQVQHLHLGHVAKSFALLEYPKYIRNTGIDIIGQIFNGWFSAKKQSSEETTTFSKTTRGNMPSTKRPRVAQQPVTAVEPVAAVESVVAPTESVSAESTEVKPMEAVVKDSKENNSSAHQPVKPLQKIRKFSTLRQKLRGNSKKAGVKGRRKTERALRVAEFH